jgi:hypothetical protein
MTSAMKPETVFFKRNSEGDLAARIDDLEVGFFGEGDGCYIVVWGTETGVPCGYTNCPEDKNRQWRNCPKADNCPYEFTKAIEEDSSVIVNEGTRAELEARIRDMFKKNRDAADCHRQKWPRPAAPIFAAVPWKFDDAA